MKIFPAIDLRGGRVVRLTRGDFDRMNVYGEDPAAAARAFRAAGADCLHVVDLDGARAGTPQNGDALRAIAAVEGLFVQVGGGLRSPQAVEETLALGARRVILGTAALSDAPFLDAMLKQYGERIAVGVDARDGRVAVDGWTRTTGEDAFSFCRSLQERGVSTVVYTDISRDGMLAGANLEAYRRLCALDGLRIIASGGIHSAGEIARLRDMGVDGAIVGKALYEGKLTVQAALEAAKGGRA
ncbi:MAG: 1-(5-phosphoribosyl)-5-[(5-phosphoribosylamino)methylideneamino]imidazole-4-carboxamide isomerase [Christensenellales bacterium]|nr:1-(5-phosphoribosyl)-5-[(5-phosphoribosylamino)methylideneamino]imidazole-4-carboxamide isomerase [Christensenellales bacterium]